MILRSFAFASVRNLYVLVSPQKTMPLTSTILYQGHLRTLATHLQSGSMTETDAPTDNAGRGERFSPTDLVATALASCMVTVMGIVAERHGWNITGLQCEVE